MDPEEYTRMFHAEPRHWWFRGMGTVAGRLMDRFAPGQTHEILDAGCGTGGFTAALAARGTVTGMDMSPHALGFCRRRGLSRLARGSVNALPFRTGVFDLVTSMDVLYFRGVDDRMALGELARVIRPGGVLVVRVAAYEWLRSMHDVRVSTGHRYTAGELRRKLRAHGFSPLRVSYVNTILFPVIALKRLLEHRLNWGEKSDMALGAGPLDTLFAFFLRLEARVVTALPLPFGVSIVAAARRDAPPGVRPASCTHGEVS